VEKTKAKDVFKIHSPKYTSYDGKIKSGAWISEDSRLSVENAFLLHTEGTLDLPIVVDIKGVARKVLENVSNEEISVIGNGPPNGGDEDKEEDKTDEEEIEEEGEENGSPKDSSSSSDESDDEDDPTFKVEFEYTPTKEVVTGVPEYFIKSGH
jgi:hypothetical protein